MHGLEEALGGMTRGCRRREQDVDVEGRSREARHVTPLEEREDVRRVELLREGWQRPLGLSKLGGGLRKDRRA